MKTEECLEERRDPGSRIEEQEAKEVAKGERSRESIAGKEWSDSSHCSFFFRDIRVIFALLMFLFYI